jgi:Cu(I)/Ag(I) efflux system membrane fusion protein
MHPQIDLPEPGQCPICGMDLIPKTAGNDEAKPNEFKMTKRAMALANIETMTVGEKTDADHKENYLSLPGKIAVNSDKTAMQTAHFGGRIEKLFYQSEGDFIPKGAKIALLYSPELVTAQNELLEAYYIKNEQPELYRSVRHKLKNWKISNRQIDKIEQTKKVITNFPMYADQSGYVEKVLVQTGNHVKEGSPMYQLADLRKVWAVFDVFEKDVDEIKKGDKINIIVNAYPDKNWLAKIDFIDPVLNEQTRTLSVRATLSNPENILKPGMLITGKIKRQVSKNSRLTVPKSAVMWTGKRSIVYVKTQPDKPVFELREVTLGQEHDNSYEILSGLNSGDEVVVKGTFTVDAAAQLQGKASMMNRKKTDKPMTMKMPDKNPQPKVKKVKKQAKSTMKCAAGKCGNGK